MTWEVAVMRIFGRRVKNIPQFSGTLLSTESHSTCVDRVPHYPGIFILFLVAVIKYLIKKQFKTETVYYGSWLHVSIQGRNLREWIISHFNWDQRSKNAYLLPNVQFVFSAHTVPREWSPSPG